MGRSTHVTALIKARWEVVDALEGDRHFRAHWGAGTPVSFPVEVDPVEGKLLDDACEAATLVVLK